MNLATQNALKEIRSVIERIDSELSFISKPYDIPSVEAMRRLSVGMFEAMRKPLLRAEELLTLDDAREASAAVEHETPRQLTKSSTNQ